MKLEIKIRYYHLSKFIIFILIISIISCNPDNCFKSTGNSVSIIRQLDSFREIEINDLFTVNISYDTMPHVLIVGGANLVPDVETKVIDNRLIIKDNNSCNWLRSFQRIQIVIYNDSLDCLVVNGQSDVFSTDSLRSRELVLDVFSGISKIDMVLNCNSFLFNLNAGTGNYTFKGKAGIAYFYVLGTGFLIADNLITGYTFITSNTTGDCYIMATKEVYAKILDNGDIYYSGDPYLVNSVITGSGKLIKLD
jgi:hypothetical protein